MAITILYITDAYKLGARGVRDLLQLMIGVNNVCFRMGTCDYLIYRRSTARAFLNWKFGQLKAEFGLCTVPRPKISPVVLIDQCNNYQ